MQDRVHGCDPGCWIQRGTRSTGSKNGSGDHTEIFSVKAERLGLYNRSREKGNNTPHRAYIPLGGFSQTLVSSSRAPCNAIYVREHESRSWRGWRSEAITPPPVDRICGKTTTNQLHEFRSYRASLTCHTILQRCRTLRGRLFSYSTTAPSLNPLFFVPFPPSEEGREGCLGTRDSKSSLLALCAFFESLRSK